MSKKPSLSIAEISEKLRRQLNLTPEQTGLARTKFAEVRSLYETERIVEVLSGVPSEQKKAISKLVVHLEKVMIGLVKLGPEYVVAISSPPGDEDHGPECLKLDELSHHLEVLHRGATSFLEKFETLPHRPVDWALEYAIRALLELIEGNLGLEVKVSTDFRYGNAPRFLTPAAEAIRDFLLAMEDPPTPIAIVNKIDRVRKHPEMADDPMMRVMRAHFDEVDASLLRNRQD